MRGEDKAREFLGRIYKSNTAKEIYPIRCEIARARDHGELTDRQERELLAAVESRLAELGVED